MHVIKLKYSACIFLDLLKVKYKSKMSDRVFDRALKVSKSQKFLCLQFSKNPNENIFIISDTFILAKDKLQ